MNYTRAHTQNNNRARFGEEEQQGRKREGAKACIHTNIGMHFIYACACKTRELETCKLHRALREGKKIN